MLELITLDVEGIYAPQTTLRELNSDLVNQLDEDDVHIVRDIGPDHEFYWDAWTRITDTPLKYDGMEVFIVQDGDVWVGTSDKIIEMFWGFDS